MTAVGKEADEKAVHYGHITVAYYDTMKQNYGTSLVIPHATEVTAYKWNVL